MIRLAALAGAVAPPIQGSSVAPRDEFGDRPAGIRVLVCDDEDYVLRLLERILGYRVFADAEGRMNRSLAETGGGLLLVSQFTLAADTKKGMRPGFSTAAAPAEAERWFNRLVELAKSKHSRVEIGRFGAHMKLHLVNDGPVTFWLEAH